MTRRLSLVIALALVFAAGATARGGGTQILAADSHGALMILDQKGALERRLPVRPFGRTDIGLDLAPGGRTAYVSVSRASPRLPDLYTLHPANGLLGTIGHGLSPTVSPDGRRLAYLRVVRHNDIEYADGLVVRVLATGRTSVYPLGRNPVGTPPELVVNWAPDGRTIALVVIRSGREGGQTELVRLAGLRRIRSVRHFLSPVFLDERTLVGLVNCCIGREQHLAAFDLRTGKVRPFATIPAPAEEVRALPGRRLLVTTPLGSLLLVSEGRVRVLRADVIAASD